MNREHVFICFMDDKSRYCSKYKCSEHIPYRQGTKSKINKADNDNVKDNDKRLASTVLYVLYSS